MVSLTFETLKLRIDGRIPSKKNSTWTIMVRGRAIRLPSQKYKDWNKDAKNQLAIYTGKPIPITREVRLTFVLPDKRKTDLTNKAESIMDTLVDAGILCDDNCVVVPLLTLKFLGVSKEPCCFIEIDY